MEAQVITIPESAKGVHSKFAIRRRYVRERFIPDLLSVGLDAKEFPAVTGREVTHDEKGVLHARGFSVPAQTGSWVAYRSVFFSHMILWDHCLHTNSPLLICEDDARLPETSRDVVLRALKEFEEHPDEGDILYLQAESPSVREHVRTYAKRNRLPGFGSMFRILRANDLSGAAAYAIRPKAAAAMLRRAAVKGQDSPDCSMHLAQNEGVVGVLVPEDTANIFMLHEVWEPYNHVHTPEQ